MKIEHVAPDLWRLPLVGPDLVNAYVAGDILLDAGGRFSAGGLLAALESFPVTAHALTHGHMDHQGATHRLCQELDLPLLCGEGDRRAVESGHPGLLMARPGSIMARLSGLLGGPAHPVTRILKEGDRLGGFTVVETPGHTPGHLAFWREEDGALVLGDVLFHRNPATLRAGLAEPFAFATWDGAANRASARKLAGLKPRVICFGHGSPLRNGEAFRRFVEGL